MVEKDKDVEKHSLSLEAKLLLGVTVLFSSVVAFFCTCIPVGFVAFGVSGAGIHDSPTPEQSMRTNLSFSFAFIVGGIVAMVVGYKVFRHFRNAGKK